MNDPSNKPRRPRDTRRTSEIIEAVALALPIPLANFFPAVAVCAIGLGLIEKDGAVASVASLSGRSASPSPGPSLSR